MTGNDGKPVPPPPCGAEGAGPVDRMEPALLLRRSDRLSVGCRGVPGAADALAVGVTRSLVTREGVDRPAVDGLLLDAVGPGELHVALLLDPLGVVDVDGG